MPGMLSHYLCGEAAVPMFDGNMKKTIMENKEIYNIGTQGPDIFFYYLPAIIGKKLSGLGSKMHYGNIRDFYKDVAIGIKKLPPKDRGPAVAYLCGFFMHYALDTCAHPYVYYKSGFRKKEDLIKDIKYTLNHRRLETAIDVLMLKLATNQKPSDRKIWQLIKVNKSDAKSVASIVGPSIKKVYLANISDKQVYYSFVHMKMIVRIMQSTKGRRKRIFGLVEGMTIGEKIYSSLIHDQEITDGLDYLNLAKSDWSYPWDNSVKVNESFPEIFEQSTKFGVEMVNAFSLYLKNEVSLKELLKVTGNKSFSSGLDISSKADFKYHDVIYK